MEKDLKFKWLVAISILLLLVLIGGTVFAFIHSDIMKGDYTDIQRSVQGIKDFFYWIWGACIWFVVFSGVINEIVDEI